MGIRLITNFEHTQGKRGAPYQTDPARLLRPIALDTLNPTEALAPLDPEDDGRPPIRLTEEEAELNDKAIDAFCLAVGGKQKLAQTLSVADASRLADKVTAYLLDPKFKHQSLRYVCKLAGITVAELFACYRRALVAKSHIEAAHLITTKLPPVVDDVMTRALPTNIPCKQCKGIGQQDGYVCAWCAGTGVVKSEPNLKRQQLALELGQLTEKRAALVSITNSNTTSNTVSNGPGASVDALQEAVSSILFSPTRRRAAAPPIVVDVQPVQPVAPAPSAE